jgi:hypothetical protein
MRRHRLLPAKVASQNELASDRVARTPRRRRARARRRRARQEASTAPRRSSDRGRQTRTRRTSRARSCCSEVMQRPRRAAPSSGTSSTGARRSTRAPSRRRPPRVRRSRRREALRAVLRRHHVRVAGVPHHAARLVPPQESPADLDELPPAAVACEHAHRVSDRRAFRGAAEHAADRQQPEAAHGRPPVSWSPTSFAPSRIAASYAPTKAVRANFPSTSPRRQWSTMRPMRGRPFRRVGLSPAAPRANPSAYHRAAAVAPGFTSHRPSRPGGTESAHRRPPRPSPPQRG